MWEEIESIYRGKQCSAEHALIRAHPTFGWRHETFDRYLPHWRWSLRRQMLSGRPDMAESDRPTKLDNFLDIVTICRNTDSCISRIWSACQTMTDRIHSLRYTSLNNETKN